MGALLQEWFVAHHLDQQLFHYTLQTRWPELVGQRLASRTRPRRIYKGVLYLSVANSVWLNELNFMKAEMLQIVQQVNGGEMIRELRLEVAPLPVSAVQPPARAPRPEPPPPRVPLSLMRELDAEIAHISDAELRQAIRRARLAQLQHQMARRLER